MREIIKVGACRGEGLELWIDQGAKNIILFEPIKDNVTQICKRIRSTDNIAVYNVALGNETGTKLMFTESRGLSGSLLEPNLKQKDFSGIKFEGIERVIIDKLDNFQYDRTLYDYMRIAVSGYELEVLKGAEKSLDHIEIISMQIFREELYKGCPLIDEVANYLFERGFELTGVSWRGASWGDANYERL